MGDFSLIPCTRVFARIEDELSSYSANGVLDTGRFYSEVKWFSNQLGLAVYELKEALITLHDHKGELPCDFYILDSGWLCHHDFNSCHNGGQFPWLNFQDKVVVYTPKECETVNQVISQCNQPNWAGIVVNGQCNNNILNKVTVKEYIVGNPFEEWNNEVCFRHPRLLQLSKKIMKGLCSKNSPHFNNENFNGFTSHNFHNHRSEDITIHKQGNTSYLYSGMKNPIIYIRYYAYPLDEETKLPLIPDDPILERALQDHLMLYFFKTLWYDGTDTNIENKIKSLKEDSERSMAEARYLSKLPSFNRMVEMVRRDRGRLRSYEILNNNYHI